MSTTEDIGYNIGFEHGVAGLINSNPFDTSVSQVEYNAYKEGYLSGYNYKKITKQTTTNK